jgi:hypothetical protein
MFLSWGFLPGSHCWASALGTAAFGSQALQLYIFVPYLHISIFVSSILVGRWCVSSHATMSHPKHCCDHVDSVDKPPGDRDADGDDPMDGHDGHKKHHRSPPNICGLCNAVGTAGRARYKLCKGCLLIRYCSSDCQVQHWPQHKTTCTYMHLNNTAAEPTAKRQRS